MTPTQDFEFLLLGVRNQQLPRNIRAWLWHLLQCFRWPRPANWVRARFGQAPQLKPGCTRWGPHLMHQWFRQAERRRWYTRPCTQLRTVPPNLQKFVPGQAASIRTSRRFQLSEELELSQQSSLSERCNPGLIYRVGKVPQCVENVAVIHIDDATRNRARNI